MKISRRAVTFGGIAELCHCSTSHTAPATESLGGCVFYQSAGSVDAGTEKFPQIRRGLNQLEISIGPLFIEMSQLFQSTPTIAFYNDSSTCDGGAGADPRPLLPELPNMHFKVEGTIVLGEKLLEKLKHYKYQTAAIAAVCAHEFGHILQFKFIDKEIKEIVAAEDSVVRAELFSDFICGYHAGIRKLKQDEYPAVIQALNQFRSGDHQFGRQHHGTPAERAQSVREGFSYGRQGEQPPETISRIGLEYVKNINLIRVSADPGCEQIDVDTYLRKQNLSKE